MTKVVVDRNIYAHIDDLRRMQYHTKGFSFLAKQPANSILVGSNVSKQRGRGLNFEELRHYRPGDDIRAMDWKTTKRIGKPHIKVYTEERERNVYIVIDQRSNMFFGSSGDMKSVVAAKLAALVSWRITDSGDRIGAVIYNDTSVQVIPAKRGRQHVIQVLTALVKTNHLLGTMETKVDAAASLNSAMKKLTSIVGNNAMVVLVGDSHGWNDVTTRCIKQVRQHNEIIACNIIDPLEQKIPKMQRMVVSDGAKQIQFSSHDKKIQERYQNTLTKQLESYESMAKKYRIPFVVFDTLTPVEKQLRKALGATT